MKSRTPRRRLPLVLTTLVLTTSALVPTAQASTGQPPDRADRLGSDRYVGHATVVIPPDRADRLGGGFPGIAVAPARLGPDRADRIGTDRFPGEFAPVVIVRSTGGGFSWLAATVGAFAAFGLSLAAAATLYARSRRKFALPS
jgi:hypothetical protein